MSVSVKNFKKTVSRETIEKLDLYNELLKKWNQSYNLVKHDTIKDSHSRHFLDSMQLYDLIDENKTLVDVGSGAGFPGLVLAIMGVKNLTIIESNRKKCLFMQEVVRQTKTKVSIINERVETICDNYQQITSRAFSSLSNLLRMSKSVSRETEIVCYFLKGEKGLEEIDEAKKEGWAFKYEVIPSIVERKGVVLKIWDTKINESS